MGTQEMMKLYYGATMEINRNVETLNLLKAIFRPVASLSRTCVPAQAGSFHTVTSTSGWHTEMVRICSRCGSPCPTKTKWTKLQSKFHSNSVSFL